MHICIKKSQRYLLFNVYILCAAVIFQPVNKMKKAQSVDTILTFKRNDDDYSEWSQEWSTEHVPGMDRATGVGSLRHRRSGRRRLRLSALTLCTMIVMHARVNAASLIGGYVVFILTLVIAVGLVASPLRHFEVYLGQWSISGPGRAFHIIPLWDGIGITICIHALLRAIVCVALAALAIIYVTQSASDKRLPFTYCRNMSLHPYEGEVRTISELKSDLFSTDPDTLDTTYKAHKFHIGYRANLSDTGRTTVMCKETFPNNFPPIYKTPAYNYFYVEVIHYRPDEYFTELNINLLIAIIAIWVILWIVMLIEKRSYGRMIWNNMCIYFGFIPWIWALLLAAAGTVKFLLRPESLRNVVYITGHKEFLDFITDVLVISTYIHSAALGSEIIHGKGLNYYASGHVDPALNSENLLHSGILLLFAALTAGSTYICALTDYMMSKGVNKVVQTSLWIFPMYSKCADGPLQYSHLIATLIFAGLAFSYMTVAFVCLKTALHTIFEYRVKLVFVEQLVVIALLVFCALTSVIFTTNMSLPLLETLDLFLVGVATPLICALEMIGMMYVYRSRDFISDINVSVEENSCAGHITIEWQIMPFLQIILFILQSLLIAYSEIPGTFMYVGVAALLIMALALPVRAGWNAYHYLRPPRTRAN